MTVSDKESPFKEAKKSSSEQARPRKPQYDHLRVPKPGVGDDKSVVKRTPTKKSQEEVKKKPASASKGRKEETTKGLRYPNKASKDYLSKSVKKEKPKETKSSNKTPRKEETTQKLGSIDLDIMVEEPEHNIPTKLPNKNEAQKAHDTEIETTIKEDLKLPVTSTPEESSPLVDKAKGTNPSIFILATDTVSNSSEGNTPIRQEIRSSQRSSTNIEVKGCNTPTTLAAEKLAEGEKAVNAFTIASDEGKIDEKVQGEIDAIDEPDKEAEVTIEKSKDHDEANIKSDEDEEIKKQPTENTTKDKQVELSIPEDEEKQPTDEIESSKNPNTTIEDTLPLNATDLLDISKESGDSIIEDAVAFGMEYFFGEDAVPKEVANLTNSLNGYTDELVEAKKRNPSLSVQNKLQLDKIEEETGDYNSPSMDVDTPEKKSGGLFAPAADAVIPETKVQAPPEVPRQSINPISFVPRASEPALISSKPATRFNARATFGNSAGFLDLKTLCRSLSYALRQHILFSRGKKTFFDLQKEGNTRFTYKLGKGLTIDLDKEENKEKPKEPLNLAKSKDIISESLSAVVGSRVSRELINSYLTTENNEDDLEYSDSDIEEVFGEEAEDFIRSYRNSLTTLRASEVVRKSLYKGMEANKVPIRGFSDVNRFVDNRISSLQRQLSSGSIESNEPHGLPTSKGYTSPKKAESPPVPGKSPSEAVPDNIFEITSDPNIAEKTLAENLKVFSIFQLNYDFETEEYIDLTIIPTEFLETPSEREIYKFCKKVVVYSKMEKEIPIIALIYVEKLILKTGLLMNELNWRRFIFAALVIASKVNFIYS